MCGRISNRYRLNDCRIYGVYKCDLASCHIDSPRPLPTNFPYFAISSGFGVFAVVHMHCTLRVQNCKPPTILTEYCDFPCRHAYYDTASSAVTILNWTLSSVCLSMKHSFSGISSLKKRSSFSKQIPKIHVLLEATGDLLGSTNTVCLHCQHLLINRIFLGEWLIDEERERWAKLLVHCVDSVCCTRKRSNVRRGVIDMVIRMLSEGLSPPTPVPHSAQRNLWCSSRRSCALSVPEYQSQKPAQLSSLPPKRRKNLDISKMSHLNLHNNIALERCRIIFRSQEVTLRGRWDYITPRLKHGTSNSRSG